MLSTMRLEGHSALVHAAAASNLGQMLNKLCIADGVQLVNVVRSAEQEEILRAIGASHIANSTNPDFREKLTTAISQTGATLAFDAVGGGPLGGQILAAMESAFVAKSPPRARMAPRSTSSCTSMAGSTGRPRRRHLPSAWHGVSAAGFFLTT
jgi:hypothetical protein